MRLRGATGGSLCRCSFGRCGSHSAGQHSSPAWRLLRLQRQRRSAAGSPSVRMLAQPDSRACRLAPGGPLQARCSATGLPGNHRPPGHDVSLRLLCHDATGGPPLRCTPLRTAFRSPQSVCVLTRPRPASVAAFALLSLCRRPLTRAWRHRKTRHPCSAPHGARLPQFPRLHSSPLHSATHQEHATVYSAALRSGSGTDGRLAGTPGSQARRSYSQPHLTVPQVADC